MVSSTRTHHHQRLTTGRPPHQVVHSQKANFEPTVFSIYLYFSWIDAIHNKFISLIETLLETSLYDIGITAEQFYNVIKQCTDSPLHSSVLDHIVAVDDYQRFKHIMYTSNKQLETEVQTLSISQGAVLHALQSPNHQYRSYQHTIPSTALSSTHTTQQQLYENDDKFFPFLYLIFYLVIYFT